MDLHPTQAGPGNIMESIWRSDFFMLFDLKILIIHYLNSDKFLSSLEFVLAPRSIEMDFNLIIGITLHYLS